MNKKELQSQVSRIKETIAKILHNDTSLAEKVRTLFRKQVITIIVILTAIGTIISTIVVSLTDGGGENGAASLKNKVVGWFKDKQKCLSDALERLAGKTVGALPKIIRSVFGAVFNFLAKAAGVTKTHIWAFIVFVVPRLFF